MGVVGDVDHHTSPNESGFGEGLGSKATAVLIGGVLLIVLIALSPVILISLI